MRQAWLVASFQHEHLPSEESGEESQLIHPGHTSISSSYYWVGWLGFFSFFLFSVCSADLTFAGKALAAAAIEPGCCARGRPEGPHRSLCAPGTSPGSAGRSGWKRRDRCKRLEPPRMCSALTQSKHTTLSPCLSFPSPRRRAGGGGR